MKSIIYKLALMATVLLISACTTLKPVQVWEKGDLAKPEMTFESDVLEAQFSEHIYFSREAANGGAGVGGGGCGCN